jgi:hypothetical protein
MTFANITSGCASKRPRGDAVMRSDMLAIASSEVVETLKSEAYWIEKRQHPRGTLIESLADITYTVLREHEHAA